MFLSIASSFLSAFSAVFAFSIGLVVICLSNSDKDTVFCLLLYVNTIPSFSLLYPFTVTSAPTSAKTSSSFLPKIVSLTITLSPLLSSS
jgi:hypothetical protein